MVIAGPHLFKLPIDEACEGLYGLTFGGRSSNASTRAPGPRASRARPQGTPASKR